MFEQINMPRKEGWANINIRKSTHQKLKEKAIEENKELQELGDTLLKHALQNEVPAE